MIAKKHYLHEKYHTQQQRIKEIQNNNPNNKTNKLVHKAERKNNYSKVLLWHGIARELKHSDNPLKLITETRPNAEFYERIVDLAYSCIRKKNAKTVILKLQLLLKRILIDVFEETDYQKISQRICDLLLKFIDSMKGRTLEQGKYVFVMLIERSDDSREIILGHTKSSESLQPPTRKIEILGNFS